MENRQDLVHDPARVSFSHSRLPSHGWLVLYEKQLTIIKTDDNDCHVLVRHERMLQDNTIYIYILYIITWPVMIKNVTSWRPQFTSETIENVPIHP